MKKENLFKIASLAMMLSLCSMVYAEENADLTSGPGVGLGESSWNGQGKVYNPGSNGIVAGANAVVEANALEMAPTSVDSTILNPIDNYALDMGPTSTNWQISLHNLNDNGPGQELGANITNPGSVYKTAGPGVNIIMQVKEDKGPIYAGITTTNIDPSNALLDMGPASSTESYQHKKKK